MADPGRSYEPLTDDDLVRFAEIAKGDREARFRRRPRWAVYEDRVLCVALCQGAANHFVDGTTGIKDIDVWTFYAEHPEGPFPPRWMTRVDLGPSRFGRWPVDPPRFTGRRVDLAARSLPATSGADPIPAVRAYLRAGRTETARALAEKAVVLLDPTELRGEVIWP